MQIIANEKIGKNFISFWIILIESIDMELFASF